jgi:predicted phage terminase large subunit-like protein
MQRAPNGFYYILDAKRMRESPANVEKTIKNTASMDGVAVKISIPQDPGQAGKAQAQYLIRQLSGFVARATVESGDKITRAEPFAAQAEAGNVKIVRGPWNRDYLNELTKFPNSTFKDYVDATSRSFNELATKRTQSNVAAPEAIAVNG